MNLNLIDLIISVLHCWAGKLKSVIKRTEVESSLSCSLSVLHAWCASMLSCWTQNSSSATCFIAVNICWDSVVKYLTDNVHWLWMLAEKNSHNWHGAWYHGRHGEHRLCAYQTAGYFCPLLVMFGTCSWSFYEWRIVCYDQVIILMCSVI